MDKLDRVLRVEARDENGNLIEGADFKIWVNGEVGQSAEGSSGYTTIQLSDSNARLEVEADVHGEKKREQIAKDAHIYIFQFDLLNKDPVDFGIPAEDTNNVWFRYRPSSDLVFVFVHGLHSDSRGCWLNEEEDPAVFWPDLVSGDDRLHDPAIFLAGYYTDTEAGSFGIENCGQDVYDALKLNDTHNNLPPWRWPKIVFVCHSMGGIVVRWLLKRFHEEFTQFDKIGLVLIASPSKGSRYANRVSLVAAAKNHKQAEQLRWENPFLSKLDKDFTNVLASRALPNLVGVEFWENRFPGKIPILGWIRNHTVVVPKESATGHFSNPKMLANTDHFSCVKPSGPAHTVHEKLVTFVSEERFS